MKISRLQANFAPVTWWLWNWVSATEHRTWSYKVNLVHMQLADKMKALHLYDVIALTNQFCFRELMMNSCLANIKSSTQIYLPCECLLNRPTMHQMNHQFFSQVLALSLLFDASNKSDRAYTSIVWSFFWCIVGRFKRHSHVKQGASLTVILLTSVCETNL